MEPSCRATAEGATHGAYRHRDQPPCFMLWKNRAGLRDGHVELLAEPEGRPGGIEMPAPPPPPASMAALFSCSEKEVSWEDSELDGGHGVFFHYVIQGLSGKADEERGNHKVELDELYSYVKDNVLAFVAHKHFTA